MWNEKNRKQIKKTNFVKFKTANNSNKKWKNKVQKGKDAENIVKDYLEKNGYKIISTNFRSKYSEIDIVGISPENILCFFEVRSGEVFDPIETINKRKIGKVLEGALDFISKIQWDGDIRFDIVIVTKNKNKFDINHIPSAFSLDDYPDNL